MSIKKIINLCILIVIIIIILAITWFILGFSPSPSFEHLPPAAVTSKISRSLRTICTAVFVAIMIAITVIWIVWHILKFISPFILGMGHVIIRFVPPFRDLEKAGIFRLWDDMFVSILKFDVVGVFRALMRFFQTAGKKVLTDFKDNSSPRSAPSANLTVAVPALATPSISAPSVPILPEKEGSTTDQSATPSVNQNQSTETEVEDMSNNISSTKNNDNKNEVNADASEESKYTAREHRAVQDKIDMCIIESTLPYRDSMTLKERAEIYAKNSNAAMTCKAKSIGYYNEISRYRGT